MATIATGDSCDDGNACTHNDICDSSGNCRGASIDCSHITPGECEDSTLCIFLLFSKNHSVCMCRRSLHTYVSEPLY